MKELLKNVCVACLVGTALAGSAASASDPGRSPILDTWKGRGFECVAPSQARPAYDFNTVSNRDEMPVWRIGR